MSRWPEAVTGYASFPSTDLFPDIVGSFTLEILQKLFVKYSQDTQQYFGKPVASKSNRDVH